MPNSGEPGHDLLHEQIRVPDDPVAAKELHAWRPDWKTAIVDKVLTLRSGAFVDVGANCGQSMMDYLTAERKRSYIGFEPNPQCISVLEAAVAVNGRSDCLIVPVGLSDQNEIRKLYLEKGSKADTSASIDADLRPGRDWDVKFVPCYKFDDVDRQIGIGDISFIKIDVEGAELQVLRGMRSTFEKKRPWILCEVLHRDSKVGEADHQLRIDNLADFISQIDYVVLNVRKSPDDRRTVGLAKIATFPNVVWTWSNASECDYMFVPRKDEDVVSRLFVE